LSQPLRVDEGFQNAAHFEVVILPAHAPQKTQFDDLVEVRIDAIEQACFVGGIGQEQANLVGHLVAADDEARVSAGGIELGEALA
jgi:hypothetical protein